MSTPEAAADFDQSSGDSWLDGGQVVADAESESIDLVFAGLPELLDAI